MSRGGEIRHWRGGNDMKTVLFPRTGKSILAFLCLLNLCLLGAPMSVQGDGSPATPSMQSYCNEPPFAAAGITSNLLLMIDNSASMYDLAYTDPSAYCLDNSYQNGNSYSGYFDSKSIYSYDFVGKIFLPGAALPSPCTPGSGSCAASTDYLYVEMAGSAPNRTVSVFTASGNFLNWLSMSKLDLEKMVLTGGKFQFDTASTTQGTLQGESRGCQGKRFVKMIGDDAKITFAVHGPIFGDPGYVFQQNRGGATTIEIYDQVYNRVACLAAVNAWLNTSGKDVLVSQANACMGSQSTEVLKNGKLMPSAGAIFNLIMSECYSYLLDSAPITSADVGNLGTACAKRYSAIINTKFIRSTDTLTLDGFCGGGQTHAPRPLNGDTGGYMGKCLSGVGGTTFNLTCASGEIVDYCNEIVTPAVTDPSMPANLPVTSANVPGFILDAGVANLGNVAGSFPVLVHRDFPPTTPPTGPTGLLQEFSSSINFGAMVFNADASSDGGKIISYINDPGSPLGDHAPGSGLVAAIDAITPTAWTPLAESFYNAIGYFANRSDLRLQSGDFDTTTKPAPSKFSCQRNNVLIVSDGMSTQDSNPAMEALASLYGTPRGAATGQDSAHACPGYGGSRSLDDLAWIASNRNIKLLSTTSPASTLAPATQDQSITTHVIFTGSASGAPGECDPAVLMQHTAASGGGVYASSSDPATLYGTFKTVLRQIAEGTNSGTDPSFLASGNGNGALFLQEQYFPKKSFDGGVTTASWIGEMQSLWYYIDPFLGGSTGAGSTIREDTDGDLRLNLKMDKVVQFQDNAASLFLDTNGDGSADGAIQTVPTEAVKALWRAGISLWQRPATDRTIYTQTNGSALTSFKLLSSDPSAPQLLQAKDATEALNIISFVQGADPSAMPAGYRSRSLTIPAGTIPGVGAATNVWKLGDIISSVPKLQTPLALGSYHLPAPSGYGDPSYLSFINSNNYQSRGTVYLGANDGMLHAFNLGRLDNRVSGDVKATLSPKSDQGETKADLGKEQWAFIPRNMLPYLSYLKEPVYGYQHLYYMDGSITLVDASIGDTNSGACVKGSYWNCTTPASVVKSKLDNSLDPTLNTWRTVLVGGMGLGGASCDTGGDCVPTPVADPANPSKRLGYSSYFALDVTDPDHPSLLWEFSNPELGYSTTGPAIVRVGPKQVGDLPVNGRWFAVFGSGPTGPIMNNQFLGHSTQEQKFFVVDLRTGALITTISTKIPNAFAGSLNGGAIDADRRLDYTKPNGNLGNYQDDAIYAGYVALDPSPKTWTRGGVGRIMIDQLQAPPTDDNVRDIWHWSRVIGYDPVNAPSDTTGPVTTSIARLQDSKNMNLWLYFGTGRYYYRSTDLDDWTGGRSLYGIKEPCYNDQRMINGQLQSRGNHLDNQDPNNRCSAPVCPGAPTSDCITDQSNSISTVAKGWRIDLDAASGSNGAERVITNPVSMTGGAVFFTSFQPSSAPCQVGNSYLWGVRYDTGDAISASIQGKALVPLSSGRVQESGLSLTDRGNRRSPAITGKPGGVKIISNSGLKPLKKIIHIQER
jgi:type IV pilus assembly protein PilY1